MALALKLETTATCSIYAAAAMGAVVGLATKSWAHMDTPYGLEGAYRAGAGLTGIGDDIGQPRSHVAAAAKTPPQAPATPSPA